MPESFDAYHALLSIPPAEQPPNHYRLLGIALFETNKEVISNAAARQMTYVRQVAGDQYSDLAQVLLDELAKAKLCLLNPIKRAAYDTKLRETVNRGNASGPTQPSDHSLVESFRTPPAANSRPAANAPQRTESPSATALPLENRNWLIGSSPGCDILIEDQHVSRVHGRLARIEGVLYLEDLKSTNGIFVNGRQIHDRVAVTPRDSVTLGRKTLFSWPPECLDPNCRVIRVGRAPDNDFVLDHASVSHHHARLIIKSGSYELEDMRSSNGTYIGDPPRPIRRYPVQLDDTIHFGQQAVCVRALVEGHSKRG